MTAQKKRYLQLDTDEHEFLRNRVHDVATDALAFVTKDNIMRADFKARFREVLEGLIGARLLGPILNGLQVDGEGPPLATTLERRPFDRMAGFFAGPDGVEKFCAIAPMEGGPDARRRGLHSALLSEISDAAGGADAGADAMDAFFECASIEPLIACGLDKAEAVRMIEIFEMDSEAVTPAIADELEAIYVRSTRGFQVLGTPAGLEGLNAHLRTHARKSAARLLDAGNLSDDEAEHLRVVRSMIDQELTPDVVTGVHRIAAREARP